MATSQSRLVADNSPLIEGTPSLELLPPPINTDAIQSYFKENPERAKEYLVFANTLFEVLPQGERDLFANDPINFTSKQFLFRGLTREKAEELRIAEKFTPQSGELAAGNGVFLSDSPLSAFSYQREAFVVILERSSLKLLGDQILAAGSAEYHLKIETLLKGLTSDEKKQAVYTVENNIDLSYKPRANGAESNYALRKEQPLTAVYRLLEYSNGQAYALTVDDFLAS